MYTVTHGILSANTQETQTDKTTFDNDVKPERNNKKREGVTFVSTKKPPQHNKSNDRNDMVINLFSGNLKEEVAENVKKNYHFKVNSNLHQGTLLQRKNLQELLGCGLWRLWYRLED